MDTVNSRHSIKLNTYFASNHVAPIKIHHLFFSIFSIKVYNSCTNAVIKNSNQRQSSSKLSIWFNKKGGRTKPCTDLSWTLILVTSPHEEIQTPFSRYQLYQEECHNLEQLQQGDCNNMDKYIVNTSWKNLNTKDQIFICVTSPHVRLTDKAQQWRSILPRQFH